MLPTNTSTRVRALSWSSVRVLLIIFDGIALILALEVAYVGRYEFGWTLAGEGSRLDPLVPALCLVVTLLSFRLLDLYSIRLVGSGMNEYAAIVKDTTFAFAGIVIVSYIDQGFPISRIFLLLFWLAGMVFVIADRFLARRVVRIWSRLRGGIRRVLVVGANQQAVQIARELATNRAACSTVLGFLSDYSPVGQRIDDRLKVLGEPMQLYELADRIQATHAVVVQSALSWESLRFIVRSMQANHDLDVLLAPGLFDVAATPLRFTQVGGASLLVASPSRIVGFEAFFKRTLDLVVAIPAFILTLPFQVGIGIYLKASGIANPLKSVRAFGFGGSAIRVWNLAGGPRLRAMHLTRLPSLWLVVTGKMSMIGPRPLIQGDHGDYERWSDVLAALKPGFIGPWWLSGRGRPTGVHEEIEADLLYARSYTIWMDLWILLGVSRTLFSGWIRGQSAAPAGERQLTGAVAGASDDD